GDRFITPVSGGDGIAKGPSPSPRAVGSSRRRKVIVAVGAVVLAVGIAGGMVWRSRNRPVLTEKDTIVLGDFANYTGDSVFDGTLREGLSVQLAQSPFLNLVSEDGIHQTLQMMEQPTNTQLRPEITREVCLRIGSA